MHLDESLVAQLTSIAKAHGGKVPIHGRLFAQWLHYVFPRDCSFPHKSGAAQSLSPTQFGDGYLASDDEMEAHAKAGGGQHQDIESSPVPASFMYLSIPLQGRRTPAFGAFGVMPFAVRQHTDMCLPRGHKSGNSSGNHEERRASMDVAMERG